MSKLLQTKRATSGAFSVTTTLPADDTIPQITEGTEIMSIAFTPVSATSTLYMSVVSPLANNNSNQLSTMAVFVDSTADAVACRSRHTALANTAGDLYFDYAVASASTTARTYTVRAGTNGTGTLTNYGPLVGDGGGAHALTTLEIMEVEA